MIARSYLFVVFISICIGAVWAVQMEIKVKYPDTNLPPNARIFLRGNSFGLSWQTGIPMIKVQQDTWKLTLNINQTINGFLEFKALINDMYWQIGSNEIVDPRLDKDSVVEVYPFFFTQNGRYLYERKVYSPQLRNSRDLVIYLPPSYFENTLKIYDRVLVMHDGQNLFNASTAFGHNPWNCHLTIDGLIVAGKMAEIVVIGVDNTPDRMNELTYSYDSSIGDGGKGDLYLDFIVQTVLPYVQSRYRIKPQREQLGILGSSLGGLISCYAGWTRSAVFGRVGCMSSSFWWNNEDFDNVILEKYEKPSTSLIIYLDSGDSGNSNDGMAQTQRVLRHLQSLGYTINDSLFYYLDRGAEHNEYYWGKRFYIPMQLLYPPAVSSPRPFASVYGKLNTP